MNELVSDLAATLVLGAALEELRARSGGFEILEHWTQGEFHHDLLLRIPSGQVIVIATNCNGGVKEVLAFDAAPARKALWALRCPGNPEFDAEPAKPVARGTTLHWFDPCELLLPDARSELRPEHRVRQDGGGFLPLDSMGCAGSSASSSSCGRRAASTRRTRR